MDPHTTKLLEMDAVRLQVADHARSSLGKERAKAIAPYSDIEKLQKDLAIVSEIRELLSHRVETPVSGLKDVRFTVRRAAFGVQLEIDQARDIRDVADLTGRAYEFWLRLTSETPLLERMLSDLSDLRPLARVVDESIDPQGKVYSHATPELAAIRAQIAEHEARIQKEMQRLLRIDEIRGALRYAQPTLSGSHHVLAVAVNHRHKVAGVVHRTSSTGETVFIEPAKVAEISAELSLLASAEQREIRRVLRKITEAVARRSNELLAAVELLGELDFLTAKARYASSLDMSEPRITEAGELRLVEARHPLLERIFQQHNESLKSNESPRQVVPISVHVGGPFDLLVITGPNTGGKTVVLKTVGLLALMARSGLHIPARPNSTVPMIDNVIADIGDEQSLQQSLSTFSGHIKRIGEILATATKRSLVLLDELGAGTDPTEGAALGQAILDELRERGCLSLVTTHLGDLKSYALRHERVENAAVEFDVETLCPTYVLRIGQFGESCALKVARRLDVSRRLLARAYHHLRRRRGRLTGGMHQLQAMRAEAEKARELALDAERRAALAEEGFLKKATLLQQEQDVLREIEKFRTTLQPGDTVRVHRFDRNGTVKRIDRRRGQVAVMVGAVEWELELDEIFPSLK